MRKHPDDVVYMPLLGVHALRIVALQVYSAQQAVLQLSDRIREWGDVAGAIFRKLANVRIACAGYPGHDAAIRPWSQRAQIFRHIAELLQYDRVERNSGRQPSL